MSELYIFCMATGKIFVISFFRPSSIFVHAERLIKNREPKFSLVTFYNHSIHLAMKSLMITFCFLLFSFLTVQAQSNNADLNTGIKEVTVFLQDAQINRSGAASLKQGLNVITAKNLSAQLDPRSITCSFPSWVSIKSIHHELDFLGEKKLKDEQQVYQSKIDSIEKIELKNKARISVLNEKKDLLDENKKLAESKSTVEELGKLLDFYDERFTKIVTEQLGLEKEGQALLQAKDKYIRQMADAGKQKEKPYSKIIIEVDAERSGNAEIGMTYLVTGAGWFPNYDMKVSSVDKPLVLNYKAEVYQNTGEDWKDVKLKLSNSRPGDNGDLPELEAWNLNYPRNSVVVSKQPVGNVNYVTGRITDLAGDPLIGASIVVTGTSVGTVTDLSGNFGLALPRDNKQISISYVGYKGKTVTVNNDIINIKLEEDESVLDEVVVTGYADKLTGAVAGVSRSDFRSSKRKEEQQSGTIYRQTTTEFEIKQKYTITSDGKKVSMTIGTYDIDATYTYIAMPKTDPAAYLQVRISEWEDLDLLDGQANLYSENTFVGRTILNAETLSDTLDISMGTDKSIILGRKKQKENSSRNFLGKQRTESRAFTISVKNNKPVAATILVTDQIPVSVNSEISVSAKNLSGGVLDEATGLVTWEITLKPGEQKDLDLAYEVKLPRYEKIVLE